MEKKQKDLLHAETRCTARRRSGEPCRNWAMLGSNVCRMHGGAAPQVRRRAQQRILEASDAAAGRLVAMMQDKSIPAAVQLAAARDLLDRANVVGTQQVNVEVGINSWERHMAEVIVDYTVSEPEVIEAEVVEPGEADETERDEELRALEARRATRKRKGQPQSLPSERVSEERRSARALPTPKASATAEEAAAWYEPSPLAERSRTQPAQRLRRRKREE